MPYLLDTNVWIHYLEQPGDPIHAKLVTLQPADVVTCSIVRSEFCSTELRNTETATAAMRL